MIFVAAASTARAVQASTGDAENPGPAAAEASHAEETTPEAPPSPIEQQRVADARQAFREGTVLARAGRWLDALGQFERSLALRSHPVTLYNVAYCERALARYTRASRRFAEAIAAHRSGASGQMSDPMLEEAEKLRAEVDGRLVHARLQLDVDDAALAIDGRPLERVYEEGRLVYRAGTGDAGPPKNLRARSVDVCLDPGSHVFVVQRHGQSATSTRVFAEGASVEVDLRAPPDPPVRATTSAPREPGASIPGAVYVSYGVGAAGLVTAIGFGFAALGKRSELDDTCGSPPRCPSSAAPTLEEARTYATLANVGLGAAAIGGAVGTYFLLTNDGSRDRRKVAPAKERPGISLRVWVGSGTASLIGRFP